MSISDGIEPKWVEGLKNCRKQPTFRAPRWGFETWPSTTYSTVCV